MVAGSDFGLCGGQCPFNHGGQVDRLGVQVDLAAGNPRDVEQIIDHAGHLLHLPIQDIHIHTSNDQPVVESSILDETELEALAKSMVTAFADEPEIASRLLDRLGTTEPFNRNPDAAKRIAERLRS